MGIVYSLLTCLWIVFEYEVEKIRRSDSLLISYTIIIISLLIQAFFYMFVITGDSGSTYDKYESGEYYLRARAYTTDFELTNDNASL